MAEEGQLYKFLVQQANGRKIMKIDPFAVRFEERPGTAAVIYTIPEKKWHDNLWRGRQKKDTNIETPYEYLRSSC